MSHPGPPNPDGTVASAKTGPRWWSCVGAGLLFSGAMVLAFPPASLWWLVLVAPLGLYRVGLNAGNRPGRAGLLAAAGVVPFWAYQMQHVSDITSAGYIPVVLWLSLFTWLFVWALGRCRAAFPRAPGAVLVAVLWVGTDVLRGDVLFTGLPWFYLGHPLIDVPALVGPARYVGVYGVTLLVSAACAGLVMLTGPGWRRGAGVSLGVVGAVWAALSLPGPERAATGTVRVAIVQTNLGQSNKTAWRLVDRLADMDRFTALTRLAAAGAPDGDGRVVRPDVIFWPETMFPGVWLDPQAVAAQQKAGLYDQVEINGRPEKIQTSSFAERLLALQGELGVPMVVGAIGVDNFRIEAADDGHGVQLKQDAKYNSAFLISGGRMTGPRYDKIELTPFGEVMPYIRLWPWLERRMLAVAASGMTFDLSPGTRPVTLDIPVGAGTGVVRMAVPICYEVTRGAFCREMVFGPSGRRADLLVNLTNDGWFSGFDPGREQHLQLARWRCLELGTPMARAANTGISAVIDDGGRVVARGVAGGVRDTDIDGVLSYTLPLGRAPTFFARHGDLVRWPVVGLAGCTLVGALWTRRSDRLRRRADERRSA